MDALEGFRQKIRHFVKTTVETEFLKTFCQALRVGFPFYLQLFNNLSRIYEIDFVRKI